MVDAIEELDRVDGDLTHLSGCLTRKPFTQDATLRVDAGDTVTRAIPCVLEVDPPAIGHLHRMTIHARFGGPARQVELDGQPLFRYATAKAQDTAWRVLRALIALMLTLMPVMLILSFWRRIADARD